MPEPETAALNLACAECGRSPRGGEVWSVYYADIGEAVTYCPECAERCVELALDKTIAAADDEHAD